MPDIIGDAKKNKTRALQLRDRDDFVGAYELLVSSEETLKAALESEIEDRGNRPPDEFELSIALQLTHIRGSIGGVRRRQGVQASPASERDQYFLQSIVAYDSGYEVEERYRADKDSYTLVQRLVARVFLKPVAADGEMVIEGLHIRQKLEIAAQVIREQSRPGGPRERDEYAFGDLMLVLFLLGTGEWRELTDKFKRMPNSAYAVNGTREVISDLQKVAAESSEATPRFLSELHSALDLLSS